MVDGPCCIGVEHLRLGLGAMHGPKFMVRLKGLGIGGQSFSALATKNTVYCRPMINKPPPYSDFHPYSGEGVYKSGVWAKGLMFRLYKFLGAYRVTRVDKVSGHGFKVLLASEFRKLNATLGLLTYALNPKP